jgi:hypothetical protein
MQVKTESGTLVSSVAEEVAETNAGKPKNRKPKSGKQYEAGGVFPGEVYKAVSGNIHEDN